MRFHVVGAGAMGLLLAAKLAHSGHSVQLITRTHQQAEIINHTGIKLTEGLRISTVSLPAVPWEHTQLEMKRKDCILLTVKQAHITSEFIEYLRKSTTNEPTVFAFQNGLGHIERLQSIRPLNLWSAITTEGARKLAGNAVEHTGTGVTEIGPAIDQSNQSIARQISSKLIKAFQTAGFESFMSNDIKNSIWSKLIVNSVINPLTAILKVKNGILASHLEFHEIMRGMMEEALQVAKCEDIELISSALWERILHICEKTSANQSSMLQDISARRETEIDYINGAIIQLAKAHRIDVPLQWTAHQLIKGLEATNIRDIEQTR